MTYLVSAIYRVVFSYPTNHTHDTAMLLFILLCIDATVFAFGPPSFSPNQISYTGQVLVRYLLPRSPFFPNKYEHKHQVHQQSFVRQKALGLEQGMTTFHFLSEVRPGRNQFINGRQALNLNLLILLDQLR